MKDKEGEKTGVWYRIDKDVKKFMMSCNHGPKWKRVVRRITIDLDDGAEIENISISSRMGKTFLQRPLPFGVKNIKTYLITRNSNADFLHENPYVYKWNESIKNELKLVDKFMQQTEIDTEDDDTVITKVD